MIRAVALVAALAAALSAAPLATPSGSVANRHPSWSPGGQWIAYASDRDGSLAVWKTDGVHVVRVVGDGDHPAWSPDSHRIAFVSSDRRVEIVAANGGVARPVTPGSSTQPAWSPDSRRLAYSGFPPDGGCTDGYSIFVERPDGTRREQLVPGDEFTEFFAPAWSPDGGRIAYVSSEGGSTTIDIMVVRTGDIERVTDSRKLRPGRPSWSPNGRYLVFTDDRTERRDYYGAPDGYGPMYVLDLRTQRLRRLTGMWGNAPAWSPRGRRIAFAASAPDGSEAIYLVKPDGSHLMRLTKS